MKDEARFRPRSGLRRSAARSIDQRMDRLYPIAISILFKLGATLPGKKGVTARKGSGNMKGIRASATRERHSKSATAPLEEV